MFVIKKMQQANALEIANNWHYPEIYSFYDFLNDKEDYEEIISANKRKDDFFEVLNDDGELMGYLTCYNSANEIEIGVGLRPDLTGIGLGESFVNRCITFIKDKFKASKITLKVATFNQRAIKVYEKCGFVRGKAFCYPTNEGIYEFISMSLLLEKTRNMKIIDLHCDTIMAICESEDRINLFKNKLQIDLQKMQDGHYLAQCFAMFVNLSKVDSPYEKCLSMIERYQFEINQNSHLIDFAYDSKDIIRNQEEGKMSAILTIEEGEVIEGDLNKLINLYELGVRMICLTWNYENTIGYPNISLTNYNASKAIDFKMPNLVGGLTPFGIELVKKMNELGVIIDVSHLSDKGFYDVLKYSNKPIVASHSNARRVCNNVRNLTDDMILKLAENGGIMGINYCNAFMSEDPKEGNKTIKWAIKHIKHIKSLVGVDHIALGSDFDGIDPNIELHTADKLPLLIDALREEGFSELEIDKITHLNFLRIFKEVTDKHS